MTRNDRSHPLLTEPEADCLGALRTTGFSQPRLAIAAKLDIKRTAAALRKLAKLGLAERNDSKVWFATPYGKACSFETIPDRPARRGRPPGPRRQRLLDLLERPMHGRTIARELGVTRQRVQQLLVDLHAQGRLALCDPKHPSWLVKRVDDESAVLSRDEERVLSALPREHATDAKRLRVAAGRLEGEVDPILAKLIADGFVEGFEGLRGDQIFRITAAGLEHPQYLQRKRRAPPPRLPVQSDRIRRVLQAMSDAGAVRTRDLRKLAQIPNRSATPLMQYLKRKQLVVKAGPAPLAPYSLTERGRATLAEMAPHEAA
jgi:hypothetical protein